jgi:hypothetical protein
MMREIAISVACFQPIDHVAYPTYVPQSTRPISSLESGKCRSNRPPGSRRGYESVVTEAHDRQIR